MKRSRIQAEDFTIGWICALPVELSAATAVLDEEYPAFSHTAHYVLRRVGVHNVVLAALPAGQYGTNSAAVTATELRSRFSSIQYWLMVGIGGGVPSSGVDIRLGDVVISRPQNQHGGVIQYDLGKINQDGQRVRTGSLNAPPAMLGTAVARMQSSRDLGRSKMKAQLSAFSQLAEFQQPEVATDVLFHSDHCRNEQSLCYDSHEPQIVERSIRSTEDPMVHFGLIASGNQVIKDGVTRDKLSAELGGVLCFEMEAAGLMNNFPCLVIRGICDYADSHKNKRWQPFAAASAAACAKEILSFVPSVLRTRTGGDNTTEHEAVIKTYNLKVNSVANTMFVKTPLTDELRQQYLESLRFDTINSRHATIRSAHSKTCLWIINTPEYQSWLNDQDLLENHGFFWIKGKPGAGKSTMMKYLLAQTTKDHQSAKVVAFFFNARGEDLEKTTRGMYQSILLQILEKLPDLQDVLALCPPKAVSADCFEWEIESLKTTLHHAIMRIQETPLFVFIDALDECDEDEVRDMIDLFEHLGNEASKKGLAFRTCFSSRHYPSVSIDGSVGLTLEEREGHQHDIEEFLHTELKAGHSKFVNEIRQEVLHRASGIFLWVVLVVRILNIEFRRGNKHAMKKKLGELPDGLERLFEDILIRDNQNIEQLVLCLQWVLFTARPLKIEELYFGILAGVEPDLIPCWNPDENEDSLEDARRFVLNNSKGLVEETRSKSKTVQFIHETVRDCFLKRNGLKNQIFGPGDDFEARAHDQLKHCCQNYFNHIDIGEVVDIHQDLPMASSNDGKEIRQKVDRTFPFLKYAVQYVLHHSENADGLGISQQKFVQEFELRGWTFLNNLLEQHEIRRYSPDVQLLYVLAEKNLPRLIKLEFGSTGGMIQSGERYGFPLAAACRNKNEEAVRALLKCHLDDGSDVSCQEFESAVTSLLAEPFACRKCDIVLPMWAARFSNQHILTIIFFNGKTPTTSDNLEESPQESQSLDSPHSRMSNLLSRYMPEASGADLKADNVTGPLLALGQNVDDFLDLFPRRDEDAGIVEDKFYDALALGYLAAAILLLSRGVNINAMDSSGSTVLHIASRGSQFHHNRSTALELLLASGASVDMKTDGGLTALHLVCYLNNSDEAAVKAFLTYGANVHITNDDGKTALHIVTFSSKTEIAEILLMHGADVNAKTKSGEAPLHDASYSMVEIGMAELLLEYGAAIDIKDSKGATPLYLACERGNPLCVKLLLEHGATVDIKDDNGETPLWKALASYKVFQNREIYYLATVDGRIEIVSLLLSSGANVFTTDNSGKPALALISDDLENDKSAMAKILKDHIAKIGSSELGCRNLLLVNQDHAVEEHHDELDIHKCDNSNTANDSQDRDQHQEQAEIETDEGEWLATSAPKLRTKFREQD